MKALLAVLSLVLWMGWVSVGSSAAEGQAPAEGGPLPAIALPGPKDAEHQAYLGLGGRKQFTVGDVQSEVVVIQIFNMY